MSKEHETREVRPAVIVKGTTSTSASSSNWWRWIIGIGYVLSGGRCTATPLSPQQSGNMSLLHDAIGAVIVYRFIAAAAKLICWTPPHSHLDTFRSNRWGWRQGEGCVTLLHRLVISRDYSSCYYGDWCVHLASISAPHLDISGGPSHHSQMDSD